MRKLALFFLTFFLIAGCDVKRVDPVVKIGMVAPFEGELRGIGNDAIYATRLAVRQINEGGGLNGYRVALVAFDDSSYPHEAASVAQALIVDPGVVAVVGHWTPETNAAVQPLYDAADMGFVPMGTEGLGAFDPAFLPEEFRSGYQAISFEGAQPPGLFAGTAYDAMLLVFKAIEKSAETGTVTRDSVHDALSNLSVEGLTGTIQLP